MVDAVALEEGGAEAFAFVLQAVVEGFEEFGEGVFDASGVETG